MKADNETACKKGLCGIDKRCSDYDEDCQHVRDPLLCWIGGYTMTRNGVIYETPASDGYCPLLRGNK